MDPRGWLLGGNWAKEQRKGMGRVGSGAGEVTTKDLGDSLSDSSVRRLWVLWIIFKHILISSVIITLRQFLRLNILGKSYTLWIQLIVRKKLNVLLLEDHFYFWLFPWAQTFFFLFFFFFQWASLSLVEALKISIGGNALKHLISSQGSWAEGKGVPQETLLCGSIYTNNEIFFNTSYDLVSPL